MTVTKLKTKGVGVRRQLVMEWTSLGKRRSEPVPPAAQPFVEVIGLDAAAQVFLKFGGAPLHLAAREPRQGSALVALIGMELATKLCQAMGPGHIKIPCCPVFLARYLQGKGNGVYAIARTLHRTDATIRAYLDTDEKRAERAAAYPGVSE